MNKKSKIWYLENIDFFKDVSKDAIAYIEANTAIKAYQRSDYIFTPLSAKNEVHFVKEGKVKIGATSSEGKEYIKSILEFGEVFGEQNLNTKGGESNSNEYAKAMSWCCLLSMEKEKFKTMLANYSVLSLRLSNILGEKIEKLERKFEQVLFNNSRSRIIEFIKEMASEKGKKVGYETLIMHTLTHRDIADITATSRQTVTTVLNDLKINNLIYFDRKRILVRDLTKLQ